MCQFKSAIILKDRVFIPDYDSHTDMLEELKIEDTVANAERLFIRAELIPYNNDVFSDIDKWLFVVDQDITPDWYVENYDKQRMIKAVKEWAKSHIHIGVGNLRLDSGSEHYIKDCKNVLICGNATVKYICGNATVKYIYGNATVNNIYGNAAVEYICDNATVNNIYGNAAVEYICGNTTVKYIYDNATVHNICGNATVNNIYGNAAVHNICDNATVKYICGNATVNNICDNATVEKTAGRSVISTSPYHRFNNLHKVLLLENSTIKDNYNKVIYQLGDYKLVTVTDGKITQFTKS